MQTHPMQIQSFIKEIFESQAKNILSNIKNINDSYERSIKLLNSANKVIFTGVGKSGNIAQKAVATFNSLGITSVFLHPTEALHGDLGLISTDDVVVLISKSGSTDELLKLFPYIKERVKSIAIVSNQNSFLAENCDEFLFAEVEKESCYMNLAPTNSTTLTLVICDALALGVAKTRDTKAKDFAYNHPLGQLGRFTTLKVSQIMHKGDKLPILNINSDIKTALIIMTDKALGCLCIESNDKLAGIITDGDIRRTLNKYDDIRNLTINEIMTKNPISIQDNITLGEALSIMENRDSQINVLPVVDNDNNCIGVIRLHDIIKSGI